MNLDLSLSYRRLLVIIRTGHDDCAALALGEAIAARCATDAVLTQQRFVAGFFITLARVQQGCAGAEDAVDLAYVVAPRREPGLRLPQPPDRIAPAVAAGLVLTSCTSGEDARDTTATSAPSSAESPGSETTAEPSHRASAAGIPESARRLFG